MQNSNRGFERGQVTELGAVNVKTGVYTGRSPKDRFIVKDDITKDRVWWGNINIPFEPEKFDKLYEKVVAYLSSKEIYVHDGYVCADPKYRTNIRTITELPWSNLFAFNMFLRVEDSELASFNEDWLVVNAPGFKADPAVDGTRQANFAILNFTKKINVLGNLEVIKGLVREGIGNVILPYYSVYKDIRKGTFKVIAKIDEIKNFFMKNPLK